MWRRGKPQWHIIDYASYAQEGFRENAIIYAAIAYKARASRAAPLRAYGGTMEEPELLDASHPLQQLVARPNTYQSWSEFQELNEVYLNISGNSYVLVERKRGEDVPQALYPLRPDRVRIIPDRDGRTLRGFLYVPEGEVAQNGVPLLPEDVMHVKYPDPLDPFEGMGYGLSPIASAARSADVDNELTKFLKKFCESGAMPAGILKFNVPLSEEDIARIRRKWQEIYGGVENWTDVGVLDEMGEYQRLGLTFDEMGFRDIDDRNESRILMALGVPPILIGSRFGLDRATYSNYEEARKAFWQDTMVPEIGAFEAEYQYYLRGSDGEFVKFDRSKVPALTPTPEQQMTAAREAFVAGAITRNEYRAAIGQDPIDGGDVYVLPFSSAEIPAGGGQPAPRSTERGAPEAEDDADREEASREPHTIKRIRGWRESLTPESKLAHWKQNSDTAEAWEPRFADAAERALERDMREILAIVGQAKRKAVEDKQTPNWSLALLNVAQYLRGDSRDNWREEFTPVMGGLMTQRGEELAQEFGISFDVRNLNAEEWFGEYTIQFSEPINATTEERLRALFQQGTREGWSIDRMSSRIEQLFRQWMTGDQTSDDFEWYEERLPRHRRDAIARTETIGAANKGSHEIYRSWGAPGKEWLSTPDDRTRPEHQVGAAWGQDPLIVGIDEPFDIGGYPMQYPGDKSAPPGLIINCRCTTAPVLAEDMQTE
jgi:HK97 family phage portal protein